MQTEGLSPEVQFECSLPLPPSELEPPRNGIALRVARNCQGLDARNGRRTCGRHSVSHCWLHGGAELQLASATKRFFVDAGTATAVPHPGAGSASLCEGTGYSRAVVVAFSL